MLTATAAIGNGTVTPKTRLTDTGKLWVDGGHAHVDDADHLAMGRMTFRDAVAYSRNVVAAKVALALGHNDPRVVADPVRHLAPHGLRRPTGIDVANEVPGIVRDPSVTPWREIDIANGAFGQGIAVTPIQLAQAYAAMVNGGTLVRPRVVRSIGDAETQPVYEGRVMPASLSKTLQAMMQHVINDGRLLPQPDPHPGLRGRRQDRHGADLGRRQGRVEGQQVQLLVRRLHRTRGRPSRPRRRGADRGGDAHRRPPRPAGDARDVVRAVPPDRPRLDQHAVPRPRRRVGPAPIAAANP